VNGADSPAAPDSEGPEESEAVLRAKYLDYCSAQLAELFVYLTPDEIFLLAHKAARESGTAGGDPGSYRGMMEIATEWLSSRIPLPPFEVWLENYREHPEAYEADLMGLWKSDPPT
jgi:hypothetical protein